MAVIRDAILSVLCHGHPTYETGYVGWGTPGFFSQLNAMADGVLVRLYRGERPHDASVLYTQTQLIGYGNVTLGEFFTPYACPSALEDVALERSSSTQNALMALLAAPRLEVSSQLLHLLYQPRTTAVEQAGCNSARYSIAVHARRGDKLSESRAAESIAVPSEAALVAELNADLQSLLQRGQTVPRVLVASDDNSYARTVGERLRGLGMHVTVPTNEHDYGKRAPFDSCDQTCIHPLQSLMSQFACAEKLMLSSRSNMGSFLISWWPAANQGRIPSVKDLDGKLHHGQMARGRHFCSLQWGSRRGMCESNHTERVLSSADATKFRLWLNAEHASTRSVEDAPKEKARFRVDGELNAGQGGARAHPSRRPANRNVTIRAQVHRSPRFHINIE